MGKSIVFIDSEIGVTDKKIKDLGAVRQDGSSFHSASPNDFAAFIAGSSFLCGHNIIHHDLEYLRPQLSLPSSINTVDTLYLSPLLFPERPYHALLKDDKLQSGELNNPLSDAKKARDLFYDEVNAFSALPESCRQIYYGLLNSHEEFRGFFSFLGYRPFLLNLRGTIRREFTGIICENSSLSDLIRDFPVELAYALALIRTCDRYSVTPPWLIRQFPQIEQVLRLLRDTPCEKNCGYCRENLNIHRKLKEFFGFDTFRTYNNEPLQEKAAYAAVCGRSLLAVFPTGGGKSVTFQLPALMAGQAEHGLTVVISPLQSLMKDQVDNLSKAGLVDAVTINGLLNPIERAEALERVANGLATLLYISPEQLRSRTIENLLLSRNVVRFVIDEAHCFSAWGQDFRVDYLYIGDFIRELQSKKGMKRPVPVSCFTATAKQKVISDICTYFKKTLSLELDLFASPAARENLRYIVLYQETEEEKYNTLRSLIEQKEGAAIVYVSRTKKTLQLAEKLTGDGFLAKPFNGKMSPDDKVANQEAFIRNEVRIIVATSAFGMGVDKKDVRLVIHYDISDSLENYVQEAGRAGRDPSLQAECYVLFNDGDLDKHFMLLNQTKLSISEIQQVFRAIKDLTRHRPTVCCSPLEIARQAGWDDSVHDIETRVKTAVAALENAGYVKRGRNVPHVYATSIQAQNMEEAALRIDRSPLFCESQRSHAKRIIQALIASRSIAAAGNDEAESRVDYLADRLGMEKSNVIHCVNLMRQDGLLADTRDMCAVILANDTQNRSARCLEEYARLEDFLLTRMTEKENVFVLKKQNEEALSAGLSFSSVKKIRTVLYYLTIKEYISKQEIGGSQSAVVVPLMEMPQLLAKFHRRIELCRFVVRELFRQAAFSRTTDPAKEKHLVSFSLVGLYKNFCDEPRLDFSASPPAISDLEDALLYLSKIGAMKIEGGFLVLYNGMEIKRLILDNKIRYKIDDYKLLNEFYKQRIQQIHIVGEYANLMVRDYHAALQFVQDYFQMDFKKFIARYFKGERALEIDRNITPEKYRQLFGELSESQKKIIQDSNSRYIVVAAGPGSGKTRVLVHKLAALLLLEDVKHEQLLMVTFSRAAATEFKKRLLSLIGAAACFVEIKTFHSYCFDLLGKIGNLEGAEDVVKNAAQMIERGEVEPGRTAKTVLVIDEAQDMDANEYALLCALIRRNEEMRVIAVGDDDQNIYEFRGSSSRYMRSLTADFGAVPYEMTENYRSCQTIVAFANAFARSITDRMKQTEITPVKAEKGIVQIIRHDCDRLEQPVVNHVLANGRTEDVCILTNTNAEALCVFSLLTKSGIHAKLIQSLDSFCLYHLAEIRFFLKNIDRRLTSPVISDTIWKEAKERLISVYQESDCLEVCLNLISDFEKMNARTRYRTDLEKFIRESKYEDFYPDHQKNVYVSTIHRAKGHEFDSVYLLLNHVSTDSDADRRKLYVAITRAKRCLYIHCNSDLFAGCMVSGVEHCRDTQIYPEAEEVILQLTHRDVVLDYFRDKMKPVTKLRGGMRLLYQNGYLSVCQDTHSLPIAKLSRAGVEKVSALVRKGYTPTYGQTRFIVAWKGLKDTKETAVLLADIHFCRKTR